MKPRYVPPRYLVRFPEGERELDALEILELFQEKEITTITPIRPVSGGDWRELREEPEFAVALYQTYRKNRNWARTYLWMSVFFLLLFALPLSMLFLKSPVWCLANWQFLFAKTGINFLVMLFALVSVLDFPDARKELPRRVWIIVPWINSIVGFRTFRKIIDRMPPEKRRIPNVLNLLVWSVFLLFFLASCFIPGTVEGGIVMFSLYGLFLLLLIAASVPLSIETKRLARLWLEQNPAPGKATGKSKLTSSLLRRNMKQILRFLPPYLAAIVLALAMLALPYWAIGSIRLHIVTAQLERNGISFTQPPGEPSAADAKLTRELLAISFPAWPESTDDGQIWTEQVRARLPEARPQLERFRQLLRATVEVSPLAPLPKEEGEELRKRLLDYLYWQREELKANPSPEAAEQVLEDIAEGYRYAAKKIPDQGIFTAYRYAVIHCRVLESWLRKLPDHTLAMEKERWKRQLAALPEAVNAYALQQVQYVESFMLGMRVPFCYRNNIRATALELAGEEIALLRQEYYRNHSKYDRFLRAYSRRSFFVTAFGMHDEEDTANRFHSLTLAGCRMGIAAIELEEFRRKHGAYPEHPELPRDPFSGKPFGYLPGKAIYCVGPDGIDDGGRQEERYKNDSYDITFTL